MIARSYARRFLWIILYVAATYLVSLVPTFLNGDDFYQRVRPVLDIDRDEWLYLFNRIFQYITFAVGAVSLLSFIVEEWFCYTGNLVRFWFHLVLQILIIAFGCYLVSSMLPFESNMVLKVYLSFIIPLVFLVLLFFTLLAPKNYLGLYR